MIPFFLSPASEKIDIVNQFAIERNLLMNVVLVSIMLFRSPVYNILPDSA